MKKTTQLDSLPLSMLVIIALVYISTRDALSSICNLSMLVSVAVLQTSFQNFGIYDYALSECT